MDGWSRIMSGVLIHPGQTGRREERRGECQRGILCQNCERWGRSVFWEGWLGQIMSVPGAEQEETRPRQRPWLILHWDRPGLLLWGKLKGKQIAHSLGISKSSMPLSISWADRLSVPGGSGLCVTMTVNGSCSHSCALQLNSAYFSGSSHFTLTTHSSLCTQRVPVWSLSNQSKVSLPTVSTDGLRCLGSHQWREGEKPYMFYHSQQLTCPLHSTIPWLLRPAVSHWQLPTPSWKQDCTGEMLSWPFFPPLSWQYWGTWIPLQTGSRAESELLKQEVKPAQRTRLSATQRKTLRSSKMQGAIQ